MGTGVAPTAVDASVEPSAEVKRAMKAADKAEKAGEDYPDGRDSAHILADWVEEEAGDEEGKLAHVGFVVYLATTLADEGQDVGTDPYH